MFLHGAPYNFAPKEQTHVPWMMWFANDTLTANHLNLKCLKEVASKGGFSHDNFFDSMLGMMNVQTSIYQPDKDISSSCRN